MENILTVTELTKCIKSLMETSFGFLWVTGEISNLRKPRSGHVYFTLKDEMSQIRAVIFRQTVKSVGFDLEDGMSIVCRGRVGVYQQRGEYQLILDAAEPRGLGALQLAFEQLKRRLEEEGLFDPLHKKEIPFLPRRIGVVTSSTGAAIRDILNITKRRFPSVGILIAPVRVQGVEAPPEICEAISYLNTVTDVDVIVVARGGGSLEDLYPFNDERVARSIFASTLPVIAAIGHEIDFTIADFVADLRAPTPSAAAELVVPMRWELLETVASFQRRLCNGQRREKERLSERVIFLSERLQDPRRRIAELRMRIDDLGETLVDTLRYRCKEKGAQLRSRRDLLRAMNPLQKINRAVLVVGGLKKTMVEQFQHCVSIRRQRLHKNMAMLDVLSPLAVLDRGYSITRRMPDGAIVRQVMSVTAGDHVRVRVSSGSFNAEVRETYQEKEEGRDEI